MANPSPDPYEALGASNNATISEVTSAHRRLALKYSPDKVHDSQLKAQVQDELQKVQEAYRLLSEDRERFKYKAWALMAKGRARLIGRLGIFARTAPGTGSHGDPSARPRGQDQSHATNDIEMSRHGSTGSAVESFAERRVSRARANAAEGPPGVYRPSSYGEYRSSTPPTTGSVSEGPPGSRKHARAHSADDVEGSGRQSSSSLDGFLERGYPGRQSLGVPSALSPDVTSSSPGPGEAAGSRWNRFRRSSAPSLLHLAASREGSQSSYTSGRSVGSQISQEDTDKFDYVLQAMEDLLDKQINKLQGRSRWTWSRRRHKRSCMNQCKEALMALQTKVRGQYGHDGARRASSAATMLSSLPDHARYRLLVHLFEDLRKELADFGTHDLSKLQDAGPYCTGFCSRIESFTARLALYGVKATETE